MNADNDNLPPNLTLIEQLRATQDKFTRIVQNKQVPEPYEFDFLNIKDALTHNADAHLARLSGVLNKTAVAKDAIAAIEAHPAYDYNTYVHLGNPVGTALDYVTTQLLGVQKDLESDVFRQIELVPGRDEIVSELAYKKQDLSTAFNAITRKHYKQSAEASTHAEASPIITINALPDDVSLRAVRKANNKLNKITDEFFQASNLQIEAHIAYVDTLIAIYAQEFSRKSPLLAKQMDLSDEFYDEDLPVLIRKIETQLMENQWAEAARARHAEEGKTMFPIFKPQPLDFS